MQLTAVCFTLLVSFLGATYVNDCKSRLENDVKQCLQDHGLLSDHLTGDAITLLKKAQMINDEAQCRKIDLYKNATTCVIGFVKLCLQEIEMEGLLPDTTKLLQGMDFICQNIANFDSKCVENRSDDFEQCEDLIEGAMEKYIMAGMQPTTTEIICFTTDLTYDCWKVLLSSCPKRTKALYLELLDKYLVPTVCQDRPPGRSRKSYTRANTASRTKGSDL